MNLVDQISQRRTAGRTTCATMLVNEPATETAVADHVVRTHRFRELGTAWLAISAADALAIVSTLLHCDLAYRVEIMPLAEASELATQFLDLVPEPCAYFTNGEWTTSFDSDNALASLNAWDPISDATFDSGVVCVGEASAALFWVEDED